jgi:uncharacterized membrane protein
MRGTRALVTDLAEAARGVRPRWHNGRITLRRPRRVHVLAGNRWAVLGAAASVLAAGMWGLRRRKPGQMRVATTVQAPVERVFDAWSRFEDFPRFMPMVAEVRPVGDDHWHWTISEPGGPPIEFDFRVTRRDRPRLIAWATGSGVVVEHSGTVRFRPTADGGTRVEIAMSWRPSGEGVDDGAAIAAGRDPERALRDGLAAFKTRLEAEAHQRV